MAASRERRVLLEQPLIKQHLRSPLWPSTTIIFFDPIYWLTQGMMFLAGKWTK